MVAKERAQPAEPWVEPATLGDALARRRLVEATLPFVHRTMWRLVGPRGEIDDLVQQVYMRAFHSLSTFRGESAFTTWLGAICVNVARGRKYDARVPVLDDGPLLVRVASAPEARGVGAVVAMNDEIHAARWARKLDTGLVSAFGSPRHAPLGRVEPDEVELAFVPPRGFTIDPPGELSHAVPLVSTYPGLDGAVIEAVLDSTDAAGLVVEGSGSGNVPGTAVGGIRAALERGLPVVPATRVLGGATRSGYGSPGGGAALRELGAVGAGPLSAGKARLLLMVLLSSGLAGEAAAREFQAAVATFR